MVSTTLAINGGTPVRREMYPTWPPRRDDAAARAVAEVVDSGRWCRVDGAQATLFEQRFAQYQHARQCFCVSSGTVALDVGLRALGVSQGDEVLVPAYTFVACAMAVLYLGAIPVFVDVDPTTHLLDPSELKMRTSPRTKAIMPVHIAGRPCDMDEVRSFADEHGLAVLEDAAQAHGAEWRGRRVGSLGDAGAFSFQGSKNITAGEGGAVVTSDDTIAARLYSLTNAGRMPGGKWYQHEALGYNLRLTELQAALLHIQLDRHPEYQERRRRNAAMLAEALAAVAGVELAPRDARITAHGLHLVCVRIARIARRKERFLAAMQAEGVPLEAGYPSGLHRIEAVVRAARDNAARGGRGYLPSRCTATDEVIEQTVVIKQSMLLADEAAVQDIAVAIEKVLTHADEL
jgi:dTDP-4-amino-4,6-dideoxygalactose transaminase